MSAPNQKKLDRLWEAAADTSNPSRVHHLTELANFLLFNDHYAEAVAVAREAIECYENPLEADNQGLSYVLTRSLHYTEENEEALKTADEAINRMQDGGDIGWLVLVYSERGHVEIDLNQHFAAITSHTEAMLLFERLEDSESAARAAFRVAELAEEYWSVEEAMNFALKALEFGRTCQSYPAITRSGNMLARLCLQQEQFDSAVNYAETVLAITAFEEDQDEKQAAQLLCAKAHLAAGNSSKAIALLEEAIKIRETKEQRQVVRELLEYLEDAYIKAEMLEDSIRIAQLRKALGK